MKNYYLITSLLISFAVLCLVLFFLYKLQRREEHWGPIGNFVDDAVDTVKDVAGKVADFATDSARAIKNVAVDAANKIDSGFRQMGTTFEDVGNKIKDGVVTAYDKTKDAAFKVKDTMEDVGNKLGDPDLWKKVGIVSFVGMTGLAKAYIALETGRFDIAFQEAFNTGKMMKMLIEGPPSPPPQEPGKPIRRWSLEVGCPFPKCDDNIKEKCFPDLEQCKKLYSFLDSPEKMDQVAKKALEIQFKNIREYLKYFLGLDPDNSATTQLNNLKLLSSYLLDKYKLNNFEPKFTNVVNMKFGDSDFEKMLKALGRVVRNDRDPKGLVQELTSPDIFPALPQLFPKVSIDYKKNVPNPSTQLREVTSEEAKEIVDEVTKRWKEVDNINTQNRQKFEANKKQREQNLIVNIANELRNLMNNPNYTIGEMFKYDNYFNQILDKLDRDKYEPKDYYILDKEIMDKTIKEDCNTHCSQRQYNDKYCKEDIIKFCVKSCKKPEIDIQECEKWRKDPKSVQQPKDSNVKTFIVR